MNTTSAGFLAHNTEEIICAESEDLLTWIQGQASKINQQHLELFANCGGQSGCHAFKVSIGVDRVERVVALSIGLSDMVLK